jgi:hypothetical protein
MTEIKFNYSTFVGTAEGDHGVFTNSDGEVYAGEIADRFACVGVLTWPNGATIFVECDADGKRHGRWLDCDADGATAYRRLEHGSVKERAYLCANGTCTYDGKDCRADYAPFVALQATVRPIKARPHQPPPLPPRTPHFPAPIARQSVQSAIVLALRRSWRGPTPTRCAPDSAISLHDP